MKTWFGLLSVLLYCCAAMADDAVPELSRHLAKTPALVVVVCAGDEADLLTITGLIEQTPWMVFCTGTTSPRSGYDSRLGEGQRAPGQTGVRRRWQWSVTLAGGRFSRRRVGGAGGRSSAIRDRNPACAASRRRLHRFGKGGHQARSSQRG